jgi:ATP-dependent Clp protease ATP-binding subunit ClpA
VEALASLDGAALKSLGMGGRDLKDKAVELLDKMGSGTALTDMRVQMDAMQAEIDRLRNSAGEPSPIAQAVKEAEELAQTDAKKGGSLAGQDTTKDASEVADELSETRKAFADFTDEDLELWLTEGGVDVKIDGRWSDERKRNELLLLAKEQLAKNAKKKT